MSESPPLSLKSPLFATATFCCAVSGIDALLFADASVVESAPRSMIEQGNAVVALPVAPLIVPLPEIFTVFPGPAMASPSIRPPVSLMVPFARTFPRPVVADESINPFDIATSPQEVIACETSGGVSANGSDDCAAAPNVMAATRQTKSRRMAEDRIWSLSDDVLIATLGCRPRRRSYS
ncbi:MAG TPA: hypothetical protein VGJ81_05315 [Thermoanaerobaculia bacterium]